MSLKQTLRYLREVRRWRRRSPDCCRWSDLRAFYPLWQRSLQPDANMSGDPCPWMTFAAIRFLEGLLTCQLRVNKRY